MSISDLFHPNFYDLFCDTLQARQFFVAAARTMGYFYSAAEVMVVPPTAATMESDASTGTGVLHIPPATNCILYIALTQPAEAAVLPGGQQRGYYLGNVAPSILISTGAAGSIQAEIYKGMYTNGVPAATASALFFGPMALNTGVNANIQSTFIDPPNVYVDQNDVYTLKLTIDSGAANLFIYGAYINYSYFFY